MESSKATSFIPYLEGSQKERELRDRPAPASGGTAFSVLAALADAQQGVMALGDLQQASGMSFLDFSQALQRLADSGYLTVSGQPGKENAQLTTLGADVAALARPA
jgi:hypothetical protein